MSRWEPTIYGALLIITLVAAWAGWKRDDAGTKESVVLFEAGSAGVSVIDWRYEGESTQVQVSGQGDDRTTWLVYTQPPPKPKEPPEGEKKEPPKEPTPPQPDADAGPDAADAEVVDVDGDAAEVGADVADVEGEAGVAVEPIPPASVGSAPEPVAPEKPRAEEKPAAPQVREFPGSNAARQLLADFDTMRALRQFDDVTDAQLEAMGLNAPKGSLTIKAGEKALTLELGAVAFGSPNVYARRAGERRVYLLSSALLGPLKGATARLMERRVVPAEPEEVLAVSISTPGGAAAQLTHANPEQKTESFWAYTASPAERVNSVDAFMEKVFQLSIVNYPPKGEEPDAKGLEPILRLSWKGKEEAAGELELARGDKGGQPVWYARSTSSRAWVEVGDALAADLADNVGGVAQRTTPN